MKELKNYLSIFAIAVLLQLLAILTAKLCFSESFMIPCFVYAYGLACAINSKIDSKIDKK